LGSAGDGKRLYIDGQKVIDHWADQGTTDYTAILDIPEGDHEIKMEYYDHGASAVAKLRWETSTEIPTHVLEGPTPTPTPTPSPTPVPADENYSAQYFKNKGLQGQPLLTRQDSDINFDWSFGSPDSSIPNDNFSARWTRTIQTEEGDHKFTIRADDGVKLWIDGQLIYDKWRDQPPTTDIIYAHLTEGSHQLVFEYYENGGTAVASLQYEKTDQIPPQYSAQYFNNVSLSGTPTIVRDESILNYEWGDGSPDAQIPADNFSARWTKTDNFLTGIYSFEVTADDGVRLYIDDALILDKWKDQPPTKYTIDTLIQGGSHTIKLEYYERGAQATAKLSYNKTSGFSASYWNLPPFSSPPSVPSTSPVLSRTEDQIQNEWGQTSPDSSIQLDNFIAQWTKNFRVDDGNYLFSVRSDDGIRVYIDNNLVLDQWNDHGATTYSFVKSLPAGSHQLKIEYYEHGGDAVAKFDFNKVNAPPTIFTAQYFDNQNLSGQPVLTRDEAAINFFWNAGSPSSQIPTDHFSARWIKQETFATSGDYTFSLTSDDGVRFWVDDQLIIDDWSDHPPKTHTPTVHINQGIHTLKIEYYENGGDATIQFR
jgi:hypothetical protein